MNNETTDKINLDANQDKPRIIYKYSETFTTSAVPTAGWVYGGTVIRLGQIKKSAKNVIELYCKDNQNNIVYKLPVITCNSSNQYVLNLIYDYSTYTENGVSKFEMVVEGIKRGGSITDTYTLYLVIFSTKIDDNILIDNS